MPQLSLKHESGRRSDIMGRERTPRLPLRHKSVRRSLRPLYIMMVPGLIYLFFNNYLPMLGMFIAFKNVNYAKGILFSDWVGFKNFEFLFKTTDAYVITRNTLLYNITFIIINLIAAVALAILLNEVRGRIARFYQSIILLPYLISMVIVGYLVYAVLSNENGIMDKSILPMLGMKPVDWYSQPKYWPVILTIVNTWKNAGYLCVIYYAAIIGLDKEYFEAAEIDGASKWLQITRITIPLIKQVIIVMTLMQVGRSFTRILAFSSRCLSIPACCSRPRTSSIHMFTVL